MSSPPDIVKVGQIGVGYWGPNLLRNFSALPGCKVEWVVDSDDDRLREFEERSGFRITSDYKEILSDDAVDAVVVATPAASHYEIALDAIQAGKHVLVEKPMALTVAECEDLIRAADSQDRILMVGHTFLYNEAVRSLKDYVTSGELGDILYLYSQRLNLGRVRQDVNALWNFAPHDVSIALFILDEDPVEVSARGFDYLQPGIVDVVFLTIVFPSGVAANIHISWLDPQKVRRMTVVGSDKMLVYDDVSSDAKLTIYDRGVDRIPTSDSPRDFRNFAEFQLILRKGDVMIPSIQFPEPLRIECSHFIECIRSGKEPLSDGTHGLMVVRILEAAQTSLDNRGMPERI